MNLAPARGRWRFDLPTSAVASLLVIILVLLHAWNPPILESLRLKIFDELQLLHPRLATSEQTVVVDIDDASLSQFGQWPWSRATMGELARRLGEIGVLVIGFDILFAEADRCSLPVPAAGEPVSALDRPSLPDNDGLMADALRQLPVVLGIAGVPRPLKIADRLPAAGPTVAIIGENPARFLPTFADLTPLVPVLREAARGAGLVTMTPDVDGIVRRVPLVAVVGDRVVPNLALESLRTLLRQRSIVVRATDRGVRGVNVGRFFIPTDPDGQVWIRYGSERSVPVVSAAALLSGRADPRQLAGRIALIGSSAAGLGDIKPTPVGSMPGVEIHAQLLETLTGGEHLNRPGLAAGGERVSLLVAGLTLAWFGPAFTAALLPPVLACVIAVAGAVTWVSFTRAGVLVDGGYVALSLGIVLFWLAMAKFIREEGQRRTIRQAFDLYLSPVMVDRLAASRRELRLGGERRELTILFSDIRSFTLLSERFAADPERLTNLLNRYFTTMTGAIQAADGTIDKYIGDAVMAFWNAPLAIEGHPARACAAALEMRRRLVRFNADLAQEAEAAGESFEPLRIGVGINTGECFVGNLGSDQRFSYSVIGDPVNVASRLEGCSKTYGVDIVLGETSRGAAPGLAALELDRVQLVGKTRPTRVYALVGDAELARTQDFVEFAACHDAMLQAHRARDWDAAERQLDRCRDRAESYGLARFYEAISARIRRYRVDPPEQGWDGSEMAESKY